MNLFDIDIIDAFKNTLLEAKKITIVGHKNIDGDCLGSALAVSSFFKKLNCETKIILPNEVPSSLHWLNLENIIIHNQAPWDTVDYISDSDVIFMLDFSDLKRIDDLADVVEVANGLKINIDHHREPKEIADFAFVDYNRSSASELVFEFLNIIDNKLMDKEIAENIFLGMVSDTGSFKYDSADSKTFSIASELLKYNIDKSKIINGLYNNFTFDRLKLLGHAIQNRIVYYSEKSLAYMYLTLEDQKKYNYKYGDHENFVNWPLSIDGVEFSVLFFESEEKIRISLRSVGDFDVNKIARRFFNGGGHKNASGGSSESSLNDTINFFEKNIEEILKTAKD